MAGELTIHDLFLPYTHLVVDETVALHVVAHGHQLAAHALEEVLLQHVLRRRQRLLVLHHSQRHVFLLLQHRQPAVVEVAP